MLVTTLEALKGLLRADQTITPEERAKILNATRNEPAAETPAPAIHNQRLLRRAEVAKRLGRSIRLIDELASKGVLTKVVLPGRSRGLGFAESQVEALIRRDAPAA